MYFVNKTWISETHSVSPCGHDEPQPNVSFELVQRETYLDGIVKGQMPSMTNYMWTGWAFVGQQQVQIVCEKWLQIVRAS